MVKERPILFSGPMVRAILEGRKRATRRVVKPQPVVGDGGCWYPEPPRKTAHRARHYANEAHLRKGLARDFCPYGLPGDRMWVRETWAPHADEAETFRSYQRMEMGSTRPDIFYRADGGEPHVNSWRPSIHMPRWASRLTLEVTEVRVQRLQEISEEDAKAEGIVPHMGGWAVQDSDWRVGSPTPNVAFKFLWNSINGARPGCSWEFNPWVWAITFKRVS